MSIRYSAIIALMAASAASASYFDPETGYVREEEGFAAFIPGEYLDQDVTVTFDVSQLQYSTDYQSTWQDLTQDGTQLPSGTFLRSGNIMINILGSQHGPLVYHAATAEKGAYIAVPGENTTLTVTEGGNASGVSYVMNFVGLRLGGRDPADNWTVIAYPMFDANFTPTFTPDGDEYVWTAPRYANVVQLRLNSTSATELTGATVTYGNPEMEPPVIMPATTTFAETLQVSIQAPYPDYAQYVQVYYTTDGSPASLNSMLYSAPFTIDETTTVTCAAYYAPQVYGSGVPSPQVTQTYVKDEPTGLDAVGAGAGAEDVQYFTPDGRRVAHPEAGGIYISRGRKVAVMPLR